MSKLSNKIKIVSSDGEVVKEADPTEEIVEKKPKKTKKPKKSKGKDLFDSKNTDETDEVHDSGVKTKSSIMDKAKGLFSGKKKKEEDHGYPDNSAGAEYKEQGPNPTYPKDYKRGGSTGGQSVDGDPFGELEGKKSQTPMLIAIIAALAIVGIVFFIYSINSSATAAVMVEPQKVEDTAIEKILDADKEDFDLLVEESEEEPIEENVDIEVEEIEVKEIEVETPQEKEELEKRVNELKDDLLNYQQINKELGEDNDRLEKELKEAKELLESSNAGDDK